ncbi:hypothetical protein [Rhodococcoides yunnanense]|uniref:hypothetical protein n=1 Tax=Rhodococcoides yunnanense TaxID=278209 RepID=UPI0022B16364|nr:hypothetical protein [Rhodococcus yunnanensis]MCZ4278838.1 hypothetical protein [Rhodococcus yunnanensis]
MSDLHRPTGVDVVEVGDRGMAICADRGREMPTGADRSGREMARNEVLVTEVARSSVVAGDGANGSPHA